MSTRTTRRRVAVHAAAIFALTLSGAQTAHAHFTLREPACYSEQDSFGSPQKSAPCGQADPGAMAVPTGAVTAYAVGGMLTLTIDETIFHPGHYRIAIANDMASLPADPPVTPGSTPCGTTVIDPAPALPLLADGIFVHTAPFSGPQTMQIPLPAGFTCDHCVLQVVEFMSDHGLNNPGGCFYHHCATVDVGTGGGDGGVNDASAMDVVTPTDGASADASPRDAGATVRDAGSSDAGTPDGGVGTARNGCGCRTTAHTTGRGAFAACAIAIALTPLRRRSPRSRRRERRQR
jgi:hypothetical protein